MASSPAEIQDERGWLIVVTSRLCLDQIKSARSRRERAHDASEIEFLAPPPSRLADPADRVTFDDGVRLALLVVLQQLSPAERVAFVLHDIFRLPFDAVAETVGRSPAACRQLASRARQQIAAGPGNARFDIASAEHRLVTEKFIAACSTGDLGLLEVLAPNAWGNVDLGPGVREVGVIREADRVAQNLLRFWGHGATLVSLPSAVSPRCSPSPAGSSSACSCPRCAASSSRRFTSLPTLASWTSSARSWRRLPSWERPDALPGSPTSLSAGTSRPYWCRHNSGGPAKEQPDERTI